jgi:hypothetical protein
MTVRELDMRAIGRSRDTVPYGADQTVYLVVDRLVTGAVDRESEIERADVESVISDLLSGQFNDPVRVMAFNTLEHWAKDVSQEIAAEIVSRCDIDGLPVPEYLKDFIENQTDARTRSALRSA